VKLRLASVAVSLSAFAFSGCGYHVVGQTGLLPKDIHTIAVMPWGNVTTNYKLANFLSASVSREFMARTRYKVVSDASKADAVLYGNVANMFSGATVFDPTTQRSTGAQITVQIQLKLVDRTGKVLFNKPNLEFRERYQISVDPKQYFDESEAANQRLSEDVAKTVVSAVLEQF
jgi:hypothetical protein